MKTYYSKPCNAILNRQASFLARNQELLDGSARSAQRLCSAPLRSVCTLCSSPAPDSHDFVHRGVPYFHCTGCGQIVSLHDPAGLKHGEGLYGWIYPALPPAEREVRLAEIYQPKLDWVLEASAHELGIEKSVMLAKRWLEVGCGEGLFLEALLRSGVADASGLEADRGMAGRCAELLGASYVDIPQTPLHVELATRSFSVLVAWSVFEHIEDLSALAAVLRSAPPGTILCFAVPVFCLSVLLEGACGGHYPRILDNGVHTQLFTDDSIDYLLREAGFEKASQWVFGQDSLDLGRMIRQGIAGSYSEKMFLAVSESLARSYDALQHAIDSSFLSDSRHVLAYKSK